jgi:hypothetical protein
MADDYVTSGEFGRWRSDFAAFQDRLQEQLRDGFSGVNERLDISNGRTRKNEQEIATLQERTSRMACVEHATRTAEIAKSLERIESQGGASSLVSGWSGKKKVAAAGIGSVGALGVLYSGFELGKEIIKLLAGK